MSNSPKRYLAVEPIHNGEPVIGRWLWAIEDARQRTKECLARVPAAAIDWAPKNEESIGSILYHMALIETDWLCAEVLESDYPPELARYFSAGDRDEEGNLVQIRDSSLEDHIACLDQVRALLLQTYAAMDLADFRRPRHLPSYDVTPEWVLHHLMQHEAEHRSQIDSLRQRAEQTLIER